MSNNTSKQLSASELAHIITGAIVNEFVRIGLVAVNTHPESVPSVPAATQATVRATPSQPRATSRKGQTAPVAVPLPTSAQAAPARPAFQAYADSLPANVAPHVKAPEGVISAKVGGEKDSRIKLPKGLFESGFSGVVLVFPDGFEHLAEVDTEGRSRINRALAIEHSKASEGQFLCFAERGGGYFDVYVQNGHVAPAQTTRKASPAPVAAVPLPLPGVQQPQTAGKKPASPAQLAARQRFADAARARSARLAASKGQSTPAPLTPLYVQGNAKGRPAPAHNVGANQMRFAGVVPVAVPVRRK